MTTDCGVDFMLLLLFIFLLVSFLYSANIFRKDIKHNSSLKKYYEDKISKLENISNEKEVNNDD